MYKDITEFSLEIKYSPKHDTYGIDMKILTGIECKQSFVCFERDYFKILKHANEIAADLNIELINPLLSDPELNAEVQKLFDLKSSTSELIRPVKDRLRDYFSNQENDN
ncbi:hypothetical protein [Paenibacillus sp. FSL E2-0178]|uniref:hypothetical protein n=1 Tax=Paenibacillus sp. FSL E2-0178 TaxID=2921361 RepID=UPI003157F8D1